MGMSFLSKLFPFLFDEVEPVVLKPEQLAALPAEAKTRLIRHKDTPLPVLVQLAGEKDSDLQLLLAQRLSGLLPKIKTSDTAAMTMLLDAIRQLTEDTITPVRVALASALKDVAHLPPDLARKLADDAERSVAEPIIRYSLSLSDEDLISLITRHPQEWHTVTIAQRKNLSENISDIVLDTGNIGAGTALLANDYALIRNESLQKLTGNKDYATALAARNSFQRRVRRDILILAERRLYDFLRQDAHLDKATTKDVLKTIQRRVEHQEEITAVDPADMNEQQIRDAIVLGENDMVVQALAARANTSEDLVRRMVMDSEAAKPVIAFCVRAGLSMTTAVLIQQRLTRLVPSRILYPKNGDQLPITAEEVQWQWDFFGI